MSRNRPKTHWTGVGIVALAVFVAAYVGLGYVPGGLDIGSIAGSQLRIAFAVIAAFAVTLGALEMSAQAAAPHEQSFMRRRANESRNPALKYDANARLIKTRGTPLHAGGQYFAASGVAPQRLTDEGLAYINQQAASGPVLVFDRGDRRWWLVRGEFWWENQALSAREVDALVHERTQRRQRRIDNATMIHAADRDPSAKQRRYSVTGEMRRAVYERDRGRCVTCGSPNDLEYDHVLPVAKGGATSVDNLQLLCRPCNRRKGAYID